MKKINALVSLCVCIANAYGTQNSEYPIQAPYFDSHKQEYVIEATNKINKPIGSLIYLCNSGNQWEIRKLEVDSTHRNQGVARALMNACICWLKAQNATQLSWKVLPKEDNLTEEQLIGLYYQILKKIDSGYFAKTTLEYRGDDNLQSPWLILDLK